MKPLAISDLDHVLAHTRRHWEQVSGRRIFISGGTGFFGAWLLETMLYCNRRLNLHLSATVLCREPELFARRMPHVARDLAITLWQGDIRSFAFPDHEFPFVIHAAAPTGAAASQDPFEMLSISIEGTRRMVELAGERKTENFLFVSSGAVYGRQPGHLPRIPENYLGSPDWLDATAAYAEGKRVAEQMCAAAAQDYGFICRIARCFAFVGPHFPLDRHFAIGNFIGDALSGREIAIRGDGTPVRSYLYAADLAVWLWTLLLGEDRSHSRLQVINVGSDEPISIRELAGEVAEELRPELQVKVAQDTVADAPVLRYVPDVTRADREFGLRQRIGLREGIRRTADWYGEGTAVEGNE